MSLNDPYICLSCGHQGSVRGTIEVLTPCGACGSILIVPPTAIVRDSLPCIKASGRRLKLVPETGAAHKRQGMRVAPALEIMPGDSDET